MTLIEDVSITCIYSRDDGGWYGEVFKHEIGRPGDCEMTEGIYKTRDEAKKAAVSLARNKWPGFKLIYLPDEK